MLQKALAVAATAATGDDFTKQSCGQDAAEAHDIIQPFVNDAQVLLASNPVYQ